MLHSYFILVTNPQQCTFVVTELRNKPKTNYCVSQFVVAGLDLVTLKGLLNLNAT